MALATASVFGELTREVVTRTGVTGLDLPIASFLATHRLPWLAALLSVVTWAGSSFFLVPLTIAVGILTWTKRRTLRPVLLLGTAFGGAALSYAILKPVVGRLRPSAALQYGPPDDGWAFPSGHTTQSAAFYGMLAVLFVASLAPRGRLLAAGSATMVLLIGFSRLYIGVHWLTDVLGGLALGLSWVAVVQLAAVLIDRRRNR